MNRVTAPLLAAWLLLGAHTLLAAQQQLPIALRQDLGAPVGSIKVLGLHDVSVIADTADYIQVVTLGTADQVDSLRRPLESMKLGNGALTVPADFPYENGINIHTSARRLHVEAKDDSQVWLLGGDTLHYEFLWLDASGHGIIQSPRAVVADQAVVQADDFATLRYRSIDSRDLTQKIRGESRVHQMGVADQEEAFEFHFALRNHRYFGGYSYGVSGWSQAAFGGMEVPMGDYTMNASALGMSDVRFGWNFVRLRHWDFGIGIGVTAEGYRFPRLMGITTDEGTGLSHFGPVDEPDYYRQYPAYVGQQRLWRSHLSSASVHVPLRVEWHRRLDYRGLRLSTELRPGIAFSGKHTVMNKTCTWVSGEEADGGRQDLLMDTVGDIYNRFRCDLRFDIAWSHVSLFVQGSLTPIFRTARKDDLPVFDTRVYPLSVGLSFCY